MKKLPPKKVVRDWKDKVLFGVIASYLLLLVGIVAATLTANNAPVTMASDTVRIDVADGHGSGVHIGHGYILTANHVVAISPDKVTVVLDNDTKLDAEVLWTNPGYDVALLRIDVSQIGKLKAAELSCRMPVVGEPIEVVGNPLWLSNAHTWGRVSGFIINAGVNKGKVFYGDITIAPGNSGGPVFDATHHVIGLANAVPVMPGMFEPQQLNGIGIFVPGQTICELLGRE